MGFDVNFNNKPVIQGAKSTQDGGAGNLGYFEREEKEKQSAKNKSVFEEQDNDSFKKTNQVEEDSQGFSIARLIAQVIMSIRDWVRKTFGLKI